MVTFQTSYIWTAVCQKPDLTQSHGAHLHVRDHLGRQYVKYILQGLLVGFRIGFSHSLHRLGQRGHNHPSSSTNMDVVSNKVRAKVQAARLLGPLPSEVVKCVHVSPIGLVPKGHNTARWQMIVNVSSPGPNSVNHGIPEDQCSLRYASTDVALRLIRSLGAGCQLLKMNLKDAYRVVPIHLDDQYLLGISWEGGVFVNRSLPFGL